MENVQVENADSDSENRPNFSRRRGPYRQYLNSETSNRVPRQTRMRWRDADVQTDHEESLAARENEVSNSYNSFDVYYIKTTNVFFWLS